MLSYSGHPIVITETGKHNNVCVLDLVQSEDDLEVIMYL